MQKVEINIDTLKEYVDRAFFEDYESIYHFDPAYPVTKYTQVAGIVFEKIKKEYSECKMFGIEDGPAPIGYFVYEPQLLISFALNTQYRNKESLKEFFDIINEEMGESFQCVLHSVNKRAAKWLEREGMKILFDSVTILQTV